MNSNASLPGGWQACAAIVERADPDRFLALMATPVGLRARLFPLYAFNVEVSRAPWVTQEPGIAEIRLQWWRDALEEIGAGGAVRAHEVVGPLAEVVRKANLPVSMLDAMVAARRWDIYTEGFADTRMLEGHLGAVSGHLMWAAARVAGAETALERPVREVAYATGLANWLMAVPKLTGQGRRPLPDDGPEAVSVLAEDALTRLRAVRAVTFGASVPVLRTAWRARGILRQAAREPARVAHGGLGGSEFGRRAGLFWRTLRGTW